MILEIIERAKKRHCHMVQLTTNKSRDRSKLFYEKLGFTGTHEGMKP
jgi:ribosomal protein S18 acetylase RimI-like enzyme